ncbi:MAG: PadR family transcriptional regulator [Clostridiales bacterium]|nr:PadR family transcriptional regulator [Clostridiales bacterium]
MAENARQGALTETVFYILISLLEARHGYAIMQNIYRLTNGRLNVGAGTLYGALETLLEKQWIRSAGGDGNSRKKEYVVTDLGRIVMQGEIVRLEELLAIGRKELGGATL